MSETRMFDEGDGGALGKLVRDALGENIRPFQPGDPEKVRPAKELDAEDEAEQQHKAKDALYNPLTQAWPSWDDDQADKN